MGGGSLQPFFAAARYHVDRPVPDEPDWRIKRAIERATAAGVDWWTWRVVLSDSIPDGLADVRQRWTFADLYEAQVMLDFVDETRPEPEER